MPITFDVEPSPFINPKIAPEKQEPEPEFLRRGPVQAGIEGSDIAAMIEYAIKPPASPYDPAFNTKFTELAKASPYFERYPDSFSEVQNEVEFKIQELNIARKEENRQIIASNGAYGIAVAMATGLLSPTILLPVGALASGAKGLGSVGKTALTTAAWSVVGATASEVFVRAVDPTRTNAESGINIGAAAVLGGILGGAFKLLSKADVERIAADMGGLETGGTIRTGPSATHEVPLGSGSAHDDSIGAARAPKFEVAPIEGGFAPGFGMEKIAARLGPISRQINSRFKMSAGITAQFDDTGMALAQAAEGKIVSPIGTIAARGAAHWGTFAIAMRETEAIFSKRADRSVNWSMFKQQEGVALLGGEVASPDIAAAVKVKRDQIFLPAYRDAVQLGMKGFDDISEEKAALYAPVSYQRNKIASHRDEFEAILREHSLEVYNAQFQKSLDSLNRKLDRADQTAADINLGPAEEAALRADLETKIKSLPNEFPSEIGDIAREIRAMEAEKRALGLGAATRIERAELQKRIGEMKDLHKDDLKPFKSAEKALTARFRNLDYTKAELEATQVKLLRQMEDLGDGQIAAIQRATETAHKLLTKLDDLPAKDFAKGLTGLEAQLERAMKVITQSEKKLDELGANGKIEQLVQSDERSSYKIMFPQAKLDEQMVKFDDLLTRIDDLKNGAEPRRAEARAAIEESLDLLAARTNAANYRKTLQMQGLAERVKKADPAQVATMTKGIEASNLDAKTQFMKRLFEAGGTQDKVGGEVALPGGRIGKMDFTEAANKMAFDITETILGHGKKSSMFGISLEKGALAAKTLQIEATREWANGARMIDFMHTDAEEMARRYTRTISSDMEIFRTFGTVNPLTEKNAKGEYVAPAMRAWEAEVQEQIAKASEIPAGPAREKELTAIDKAQKAFLRDAGVAFDRTRHTYAQPTNPDGMPYRLGAALLNLNYLRMMGLPVISSISDLSRTTMKFGVTTTFKAGFIPLIRSFKDMKATSKEIMYLGGNTDLTLHGNSTALADVLDDYQAKTAGERMLQGVSNRYGLINGMDAWNYANNTFAGAVANGHIMRHIDRLQDGKPGRGLNRAILELAKLGIDGKGAKEILHQMNLPGGSTRMDNGILLPNTKNWSIDPEGRAALMQYRSALHTAIRNTVIVPGLNKPNMMDASMTNRLIFQFKSFGIASTSKVLAAGLQDARAGNMAPVIIGSMSMLALSAISLYIRGMITGGKLQEDINAHLEGTPEDLAWWSNRAFDNSGMAGIFAYPKDAIMKQGKNVRSSNPFQDAAGPTLGMVLGQSAPVTGIANSVRSLEWDPKNAKNLHSLMPFQNHWALEIMNQLTGAFDAIDSIGANR